jgi:signal recognition particle receptor subunit beta
VWVVLANANDQDSLRTSRKDVAFVRSLGDAPVVVAAYMSMPGEELTAKQIAKALGVGADVPVLQCHLRDRESVFSVARTALDLARG